MRKNKAFKEIKPKVKSLKEKVLEAIYQHKGMTTFEVIRGLKLKHQTATARLSELEQDGLISQSCKVVGLNSYTFWSVTPFELIELRKQENWNKRMVIWLEKGIRNGFITKKELDFLKKQSKLF